MTEKSKNNFADIMAQRVSSGSSITLDKYVNLVGQNFIIRIIFIIFLLFAVENSFTVLLLWYIFSFILGYAYKDMNGFPYYFAYISGKISALDKKPETE